MPTPTLALFCLLGRAYADITLATEAVIGKTVGIAPTSITFGGTAGTDLPAGGTITFTADKPIFVPSISSIQVTITHGGTACTAGADGVTGSETNPILTITTPTGCAITSGAVFTVLTTHTAAFAVTQADAVSVTVATSADATGHAVAYTPVPGLDTVTAVASCLGIGDIPRSITVGGSTGNDDAAALASGSVIEITSATTKIFEGSQTFTVADGFTTPSGSNCAIAAATSSAAVPTLTLTLSDSASTCAIAKDVAFTVVVANQLAPKAESTYFARVLAGNPTAAVTVSVKAKGTTVAPASAYTPLAAPIMSKVIVNNQKDGVKPASIIFGFKNIATAITSGTITVTPKDPYDDTAIVVLAASLSAKTATVKAAATETVAATFCTGTFTTDSSSVMTLTLSDGSTACSIGASHYVEVEVTDAASIAVNPTAKGLGAAIQIASGTTSCTATRFHTTGTAVTVPTFTATSDSKSWTAGAKATTALAAADNIYFAVDDGFFTAQTAATSVTLVGATACTGTATSTTSIMTVTLASSTTTCAIAAAADFTVTATSTGFGFTAPTADTTRQAWVWTSKDLAALHGATALTSGTGTFVHKAAATTTATPTNSSTNASSNSTTVGVLIQGSIHLHAPVSLIAMVVILLTSTLM